MGLLLVISMSLLGRAAGGGLGVHLLPGYFNRLPEALLALPFGLVAFIAADMWQVGLAAWIWSFAFIEIGHGNAYHMGFTERADRWQSLDYVVRPLLKALRYIASKIGYELDITPRGKLYCWVFMAIKGGFIALPLLPVTISALAFMVAFPLAYHVSMKETGGTAPAEYLAWAFAGALIMIANMTL